MTDYVALKDGIVVARTNNSPVQLYRGAPVPADATSAAITHLLQLAYIEEGGPFGGSDVSGDPPPLPRPSSAVPLPSSGDAGTVLTVNDDGSGYELAPGGAPQLAAKSTDATPTGGPGLYALTSTDPLDGGWTRVDIQETVVDLTLAVGDGTNNIGLTVRDPYIDGPDTQLSMAANSGTKQAGVLLHATAAESGFTGSAVRADDGASGALAGLFYEDSASGAYVQVTARTGQAGPLLSFYSDVGAPLFSIEADGHLVLNSPNGNGHRLLVANDGTLSTEAV